MIESEQIIKNTNIERKLLGALDVSTIKLCVLQSEENR